ncbi:MAG: hypothetical protein GPJ54_02410 [Candidatus Heimdallarchaeota archaeon]|nr:hypothetical protein [Candidatus Heimdallarchaeota archaeon]
MSNNPVSKYYNMNKEKIWETISTPGIVHNYHPFCKENPVLIWNGKESVDEIIYENDRIYRRVFKEWYEGIGYDLSIEYKGRSLADVFWRINEVDDEKYELKITLKPRLNEILPNVPRFLRWIPYYGFIHWQMNKYLDHVMKGFDNYVTTGVAVKPNQFGRHKFFS